ncbi:hypothetical protein SKAU_G00027390 [Synaphobranchus kaupii]|uniref:USP domain-containing protein n=1 Tax=Synaphobranchus kaupii TaxID=118154 RepID=A0A9Q1GCZ2_SYNKA|nr:hypothetical protein SKAU_G00027390 [Synaphobranchus kaupii]
MAGRSYSRSFLYPDSYHLYVYYQSPYGSRFQGLRGLPNYGLSCCVNALLQSFSATQELLALLNRWIENDSGALEKARNVPQQLQKALQAMQSDRFLPNPHQSFLYCLDRNHIPMSVQHDADEVFISILNLIQEQMSDTELAQQIKCLYMVKLEEHLQCNECTYIQSGDTYMLSLPLPLSQGSNTLEDCFRAFFELQELDNEERCFCDRCGEKTPSKQGLKLIYLPSVVCVHLKRFHYDHGRTEKMHCEVSFPQALDFNTILKPEQVSQSSKQSRSEWQYKLYAVIVHCGTAMFGHYTAYIKPDGDIWYHANDSRVSQMTWADVEGTFGGSKGGDTAYMLLYRRTKEETEPDGRRNIGERNSRTEFSPNQQRK